MGKLAAVFVFFVGILFSQGGVAQVGPTGGAASVDAGIPDPTPAALAGADAGSAAPGSSPAATAAATAAAPLPALPDDRKPTLKLTVEPREAAVGEVVHWNLEVTHRVGDRVHLSSGASFGKLEVHSKDATLADPEGDWVRETLKIELVGFEAGDVEIPAQKVTVVDEQGRIGQFESEPVAVKITSLIANEPEPQLVEDTGPGVDVLEKDYTLLWVVGILLGIGVVALLTLLVRWLWSKRRPRPEPPPPPPRPAHEIALEKLAALRVSNLLEEGNVKEFHVRLSETIREYLGNRYDFDSLELSSEELIQALRKTSIGKVDFQETVDFLSETDLVKFAKVIPSLEESRRLLDLSVDFVDKTTPKTGLEMKESGGDLSEKEGGHG